MYAHRVLTPSTPISFQREMRILRERGTALIFALVMLLILTILGITAVTTSSLQEKMAGNMRDQYMAQQAGDSILQDAEGLLYTQLTRPNPTCPPANTLDQRVWNGMDAALPGCLPDITTLDNTWWNTNGFAPTVALGTTSQEPRYVVELIQKVTICLDCTPKTQRYHYRATGWSVGATDFARGLFQSVFSKKSDEYE